MKQTGSELGNIYSSLHNNELQKYELKLDAMNRKFLHKRASDSKTMFE